MTNSLTLNNEAADVIVGHIRGLHGLSPILAVDAELKESTDYVYWELSFPCPWGCKDKKGRPRRHVHGESYEPGIPPLDPCRWTGRVSHCLQPSAPSSYELRLRQDGE